LSEPAARGAVPSQLAPEDTNHPARAEEVEVEKEFNEENEDEEEMDEDSDDDFSGRYRNPAMRRRSWRERV
jgi:ribosomal protein L12E/L44/L45/RPP1/RPP2